MARKTILVIALLLATVCGAQERTSKNRQSNYVGLTVGGGGVVGTLFDYSHGFEAGLRYTHFYGNYFGLTTGVTYHALVDSLDKGTLSVPIQAAFRQPLGDRWNLMAALGVSADYQLPTQELQFSALADLGARFAMSRHWGVYAGVYGIYQSQMIGMDYTLFTGVKLGVDFGWKNRPHKSASTHESNELVGYEIDPEESKVRLRERGPRKPKPQPVVKNDVKAELQRKLDVIGATVYFKSAGVDLEMDQLTLDVLHVLCDAMAADSTLRVTVTGHTDNTGSVVVNMEFGMQRAEALRDFMVRLGAPAQNIDCESRGKNQPVATNDTPEGRARNRRATVTLQ